MQHKQCCIFLYSITLLEQDGLITQFIVYSIELCFENLSADVEF